MSQGHRPGRWQRGQGMRSHARQVVQIDALAGGVARHVDQAIICIDVLLSTTTLATAAAQGRRTLVTTTAAEARVCARGLTHSILAAEPGLPGAEGFDPETGPASLEARRDVARPLVLATPAGHLLFNARRASAVYVSCLRNMSATADLLSGLHERVVCVGAGHGSDVRCEDQIAAAWLGRLLLERGFEPADHQTAREIDRWSNAPLSLVTLGRGAAHLRQTGRERDLEFTLSHVDDLKMACRFQAGEIHVAWPSPLREAVG
ncbi:MAG TPA: 2-phosphosulfolactate phosphatase [Vicinamibacteria bacterium]|nr:2-phosphosulfolactate phosphatase [Vicinamibacteria bacterium]